MSKEFLESTLVINPWLSEHSYTLSQAMHARSVITSLESPKHLVDHNATRNLER